jgi:hypothetical protein
MRKISSVETFVTSCEDLILQEMTNERKELTATKSLRNLRSRSETLSYDFWLMPRGAPNHLILLHPSPWTHAKRLGEAFPSWILRFAGCEMREPRQESWKHPRAEMVCHVAVLLAGILRRAEISQLGSVM